MRCAIQIVLCVISFFPGFAIWIEESDLVDNNSRAQISNALTDTTNKMRIKIGSKTFNATLSNSPTAAAFKAMLPLTISMTELNGNEKYFHLSKDLPTNASVPEAIRSGDLMIWGSNSLVLFYKSFSTSYSYTKLGRVNDAEGLAVAVGPGNVTVELELE